MSNAPARSAFLFLRRHWPWLIVSPILLSLLGISAYAVWQFEVNAERHLVPFAKIEINPIPAYVSPAFLNEVRNQAQLPEPLDAREPKLAENLQQAFQQHPWVQQVEGVQLLPRGRILVRLIYRRPVAEVAMTSTKEWVDALGIRLPPSPTLIEKSVGIIRIMGQVPPPAAPPGKPWGDPGVEIAARLAGLLENERSHWQLIAIELAADPLLPELRLRTRDGTQVLWQELREPASESHKLEEPRLRQLRGYCDQYGSLEKPAGPYVLDVRSGKGIVRRAINP